MKVSLHIGINYAGSGHDLAGCINDAMDWSSLCSKHGFTSTTLLEQEATKSRMVSAIADLVHSLNSGDTGVITYSGHGSWLPDRSGDEPDGRDEVLCPFDMGKDGTNMLLDDDLFATFTAIHRQAKVFFVSDSCHSGTVFRMAPPTGQATRTRPRFLPPAHFLQDKELIARMERAYSRVPARSNAVLPRLIHLSGCRDTEYSSDAYIDNRPCGAMSHYAIKALDAAATKRTSYLEAFRVIRRSLPSWNYQQTPLLNAPASLRTSVVF